MRMKLMVTAALAASALSAQAAGPGDLGTLTSTPVFIGNTVLGQLLDLSEGYTFTLGQSSDLGGTASALAFAPYFGIDGFAVALLDAANTTIATDTNPADGFLFQGLTAGSYTLSFSGTTSGTQGGSYAGVVVAQAVPEPETLAMMLAGLGALGFLAVRRRND